MQTKDKLDLLLVRDRSNLTNEQLTDHLIRNEVFMGIADISSNTLS